MSQNWRDTLGEAKTLMEQIKALGANEEAPEEEKAKIPEMIAGYQTMMAEVKQFKALEKAAVEMDRIIEENNQEAERETKAADTPGEFKEWKDFLYASWRAMHQDPGFRKFDPRLQRFIEKEAGHEQKQMVENVGASGGFLVPTEFLAQMQALVDSESIVRPRATIIRMRRRQIDVPVLDQTGSTAGTPNWFGGLVAYWGEEAAEKTISTAKFRKVTLEANKLIMYTRASDELLDDSAISLSDFLAGPMGFGGAVPWYEDYAFLQGTGAGQPLGIINAGATITVNRASVGTPIQFVDLANMMENFLPSGRGVWIITQSAMADIIQMSGPTGNASYIWQPNARDGIPGSILGLPVIWNEKVPLIGNAGDVILADWRYYLVGDRQATTVESTKFDKWAYDQTSWRAVHRVDGQPWLSAPLTYQDGTTQVSPFVILGDKST